jgi:hypothetical protein
MANVWLYINMVIFSSFFSLLASETLQNDFIGQILIFNYFPFH